MDESFLLAPSSNGSKPPSGLFTTVAQQIMNVRRWNEELEWGFGEEELAALDPIPRPQTGLVVDVVVPYLRQLYLGEGVEGLDGVRHTCLRCGCWLLSSSPTPGAGTDPGISGSTGPSRCACSMASCTCPGFAG